jgi:glycosyltransferase involved in cell wall biosynthesis
MDADIVFFSCNFRTLLGAFLLRIQTGLSVRAYRKNTLNHTEILALFSKSRLYVGVSLSDGLSTSAIEAMAMGAFPIQSSTSCASEWFVEGVSGRSLFEISPSYIGKAITESFAEGTKLDDARKRNLEIVSSRFHSLQLSKSHLKFYT